MNSRLANKTSIFHSLIAQYYLAQKPCKYRKHPNNPQKPSAQSKLNLQQTKGFYCTRLNFLLFYWKTYKLIHREEIMSQKSHEKMVASFLDKIFREFDKDNNRRLSRNEFPKVIRILSQLIGADQATEDQIDDIFNLLDFNGDQTIDKDELYSLIKTFFKILEDRDIQIKIVKQSDLIL